MPFFILLFGAIFALLSFFKYSNKALAAFKKVNKEIDKKVNKKEAEITKKIDNRPLEEMTLIEKILRGERAILAEYDHFRKVEERNKILRFNNP